jgi:hypothetical protein
MAYGSLVALALWQMARTSYHKASGSERAIERSEL